MLLSGSNNGPYPRTAALKDGRSRIVVLEHRSEQAHIVGRDVHSHKSAGYCNRLPSLDAFTDKANACILFGAFLHILEPKHMIVPRHLRCLPAFVIYLDYLETLSAKKNI